MSDTKVLLKKAREAIKNKDFTTSIELCRDILRNEKNNHMALLFLGVSLQEIGEASEALKSFQNAIKSNPKNALVWNGLINYYEKVATPETRPELVKAYISILNFETVDTKLIDYCKKMCALCDNSNITDIVQSVYSLIENGKCTDVTPLFILLAEVLSKNETNDEKLSIIYEEVLNTLTSCENPDFKHISDYLKLLYKLDKSEELLTVFKKAHTMFNSKEILLEYLCKTINKHYIEFNLIMDIEEVQQYCTVLLELSPQSKTAKLTNCVILIEQKKFLEAKASLGRIVSSSPVLEAWILLLMCCTKLHLVDEAIFIENKIELPTQGGKLENVVKALMVEVLSRSCEEEDLIRALSLYGTLGDEFRPRCTIPIVQTHIALKQFTEAEMLIHHLGKSEDGQMMNLLKAQLLHKQEMCKKALELLQDENAEFCEWWLEIGLLYWDLGQRERSLTPFLKAAKYEPTNYKVFLLLGDYYKEEGDVDKARRCYEKSFKINGQCSETGIKLSKIYRKLKNWDANLALLQGFTSEVINRRNAWAWVQMGLHYLEQSDYQNAINTLRYVIRVDDNNVYCWESLADAYLATGAYTSALKCYEKASTLAKEVLYPLLQMASIKQSLGEFTEAISDFENILKCNNTYVPALKGIAETCLLLAKQRFNERRLGACRDYIQRASRHVIT